ncbi:MAG TPA: RND transporter, partial [Planctomycetaceae bacterium]|nr:RND transporter [Planctomycetaceae bacterium]
MVSSFYQRHGRLLLWIVAFSFPFFYWQANSIKSNNDIETWLPRDTGVRQEYEQFKRDFGVEEVIVIGLKRSVAEPDFVEAVAGRIDRLKGIRTVWTPDRMSAQMESLGVTPEEARQRMDGLLGGPDGELTGVIVLLDDTGAKNRADVVAAVQQELTYCQLDERTASLTGPPVIVSALDTMGSQAANKKYFAITVGLCLALLYFSFAHWGMALSTLGVTLWGIYVTQTVLAWAGGEMNFIMGSLSVMTMIFTLSIAVHFVSYFVEAKAEGKPDPLGAALTESAR